VNSAGPACRSCGRTSRPGTRFCGGCGATLTARCPACGAVLEDPAIRFCENCGSPLAGPVAPTSLLSVTPDTPRPAETAATPAAPRSFGAGRYEVRRFLGEGGRKRVYQAYDRALDRDVAVATIKTEDLDTAGLERVRREAQAMGRLGDHPHIVTVYDIGDDGGRPFIVSQYMPGGSVDDLLAGAADHRLAVGDAVRIADEVCQALEHAHSLGIVHRDIKPANVWLTDGGSTRLGDFGLAAAAAASASRSRLTKEGMMVGTVAYMAPEQALGQEVDARADLYALGALLYELLTGRPPFVGPDAVAVISQQINTPPMAPWWHNPAVPKELGSVVLDLLAKTPDERPVNAADVRRRLAETVLALEAGEGTAAPETPAPAASRHTARLNRLSRFVGRADELRDLKRAVEGALSGRGGVVMVSGEPGIGKTRLVEEACVYARLGGAQILVGHAYEAESTVPYMPFVEAIRAYVAARPPEALRDELGDAASEVAKLVSEIRNVVPGLAEGSRPSAEEERYRLFESVCSFLVNASRAIPIVLLLDDLHWADTPTLRLLQHLSRQVADSRLLVVGTYRDVELSRRHPLSEVLVELRRQLNFQLIVLHGLSLSEVQDYLEGITERALEPAEQPLAAAFYGETEGNPYFLEEVVRHLLDTGGAFWEGGRWQLSQASVESLSIPEGIRALVDRRLTQLSETGADVLTKAAVLGTQFDFAVLEHMTGLDDEVLLHALEAALDAQLLEQAPIRHGHAVYRFAHAVIRQSLYEGLSLPRQQRLHRRAAEAIEAVYARNPGPHLPALALHYRQAGDAGDAAKAVEYSLRAGDAARVVFAYEDAAAHWEAALELLDDSGGDDATRARLFSRLGDLHFASGLDYERSTAYLGRALALYEALDMPERVAQIHSRLGRNLSSFPWHIDIPRALRHLAAAEQLLSARPTDSALGYIAAAQVGCAAWAVRTPDGLASSELALAVAAEVGNQRLGRHAAALQAFHLAAEGRLSDAMAQLQTKWVEADAARDANAAFTATWVGASTLFRLADPVGVRTWCQNELGTGRHSQAPYPNRMLLDGLGRAEAQAGDLVAARRARDECGDSRYAAPYVALYEGRFDDASRLWEARRTDDDRVGNRHDEWTDLVHLAVVYGLQRHHDEAELRLRQALAITTDGGMRVTEVWTRAQLAVLLADTGRAAEAREHLARAQELTARGEDWRGLHGRVTLAEAVILSAEGRLPEASERYAAAIEVFSRLGLVWDEADAHRRSGQALLRRRDRAGAIRELATALELYRRHGAGTAWIEPLVAEKLAAQGVDSSEVMASVHLVAAAVEEERPDLASHTSPEGTVTLLFSDIEGSTAANERLGDRRWMEVLRAHNRIVREEVARHGGFEVKSQGDGFMVAFASARRGLASAMAIQRALRAHAAAHPEEATLVRMGLHTGEAVKEGDDFFGTHVALAARIAAAARGGEILVSSLLKDLADGSGDMVFGAGRDVDFKGFSGSRRVYPLHWEDDPARTAAPGDTDGAVDSEQRRLVTLLLTDQSDPESYVSPADAVTEALRLVAERPSRRVAVHAEMMAGDGDAGAEHVLTAARGLHQQAEPGQVVCSDVVTGLLAGRPRFAFASLRDTGAFELRTPTTGGPFSAPAVLIGRDSEMNRLVERLDEAAAGRGGLVMLAGDQGVGKSRLIDELATRAERKEFSVLWGGCREGDWPPPYGPFIEALGPHAQLLDPEQLADDLGEAAGVVAELLPAVRRLLPLAGSTPVPPEEERHRIFDGVGRFLSARSRRAPVTVLLDDLHWADRTTVGLLRHLSRLAGMERVLLVGTYRDVDLDRAHPLTEALSAWPRESGYEHLRLGSLDGEEVAAFLSASAGQDVDLKVGAAWARETGGNPFFILELLRHLHEEGKIYRDLDGQWTTSAPLRELALPVAARDVALRRLSRLSDDANRLLTVAAAFEGVFRFETVIGLAGLSEESGLDALEETVDARILEPSGDSETYAFTHAVIRHALYDRFVPSRRSRLHRRVAEALEASAAVSAVSAAEIAVHYHRSVALPGAERGADPAVAAADEAQATGAYDEAATFLRMALDLIPTGDDRRPRLLGRLGIVLAWALAFDDAVSVAGEGGQAIAEAETKQAAAEYLADAAYACASAGGITQSWELARQGLTYAGARDVAWARMTCFDYQRREAEDPDHPGIPLDSAERREAAAILRAAHLDPIGPGPMEAVFDSRPEAIECSNLILVGSWAGEHARVLPALEAEAREAESLGRLARAARALAAVSQYQIALGYLAEGRRSMERAKELADRLGAPVPTIIFSEQLLCSVLDEGWEHIEPTFSFLASSDNPALAWTRGIAYAGQAHTAAHLGQPDVAVLAIRCLAPWLERAPAWAVGYPMMACGPAEALWMLERFDHGDVIERALRQKVLPADFRFLVDGNLALARLCALTDRHDEAERWFDEARRRLDEEGSRPLRAVCDFDEALMYARRGGAGDSDRARPLLAAARRQFEDIGMTGWIRRVEELEPQLKGEMA